MLQRVHTHQPAQPRRIIPRAVIIKPGFIISFFANVFVSLQTGFNFISAGAVGSSSKWMILLIRNDLCMVIQFQAGTP